MKTVIRTHRSKGGMFIENSVIVGDPTPGTWGSHQMLLEEYKRTDEDYYNFEFNPKLKQVTFNEQWLDDMNNKYGELHCEYCGKPHLKVYHWNVDGGNQKPDMATADHFLPKHLYIHLSFNRKNLRVACIKCNKDKGRKIVRREALMYEYPEKDRLYQE